MPIRGANPLTRHRRCLRRHRRQGTRASRRARTSPMKTTKTSHRESCDLANKCPAVQGVKQSLSSPDSPAGQNLAEPDPGLMYSRIPWILGRFSGFLPWIPPGFLPGCRYSWIIIQESGFASHPAPRSQNARPLPGSHITPRTGVWCPLSHAGSTANDVGIP